MSTTPAKVVWVSKQGESISFDEALIPGGLVQAVLHARTLVQEKDDILLGQILANDGLVLATFTGGKDDELKFAN